MSYQASTAVSRNSTGQLVGGPCTVTAAGILGGSDAATVKIYDGLGQADALRWGFGVGANLSDSQEFECLRFTKGVYIVVTGTTPNVFVAVQQPRSNQVNHP